MTDFNNQNNTDSTPKYSPLTSDYDNPSNNITQEPQIIQTNITPEENNLNKSSGEYTIYRSPYGFEQICELIFLIIFSVFFPILIFIFFRDFENYFLAFLTFPPIFGIIVGFCVTSSYYIIYDSSQKTIILKREKIFKCFKRSQIIQMYDIQKVILEKYKDSESNHLFKINFILVKGTKVTAVNIRDKGEEYTKAFQSLKKHLPEEIYFEELCTYSNK